MKTGTEYNTCNKTEGKKRKKACNNRLGINSGWEGSKDDLKKGKQEEEENCRTGRKN